jgi:tetratricopeptide (TPR) repeat protein
LRLLDRAIHFNPNSPFVHCHRGYALQDLGRRQEAIVSLERALRIKPDFVDAHIALGTIHAELGEVAAACAAFDRAVAIDPGAVEALLNKGLLLEDQRQLDDAITVFDKALLVAPGNPAFTTRKASCFRRQGRYEEALQLSDAALIMHDSFAPLVFERALILAETSKAAEAIVAFERAAEMQHEVALCHYNIGNCLVDLGFLGDAEAAYRQAAVLHPAHIWTHVNLGRVLQELSRPAEALVEFERAILLQSDHEEALIGRATALVTLGRTAEAMAALDRAVAVHPGSANAYRCFGNSMHVLGHHQESHFWHEKALSVDPRDVGAIVGLGDALAALGRHRAALTRYAEATAIQPDCADAHYGAAGCHLVLGDLANGWRLFEWRWKIRLAASARPPFRGPPWLGESDVCGTTILLWADMGHGDTLQFVRYAPLLVARGARVVLAVQSALVPLLKRIAGVSEVIPVGAELPPYDLHCPINSLPLAFGTTLEGIPAAVPYVSAVPACVEMWRDRLAALPGRKVGLVWAGNPVHPLDRLRSLPPTRLVPLGSVPNVTFVSLQKGTGAQQARNVPTEVRLHDWSNELSDFSDTAALIDALDLVIGVDTAVVHLAGALGKPVWMLNRYNTCWRWLTDRDDSPWYPSMRLFRQPAPHDWPSVVARVCAALQERDSVAATGPATLATRKWP